MEKTSILDFISKLTENASAQPKNTSNVQNAKDAPANQAAEQSKKSNAGETESFMRSYNPLSYAYIDKNQITSPRALPPNKSTIYLNNGKNLAGEKKQTTTHDMVRFINRHNMLSNKIKNDD